MNTKLVVILVSVALATGGCEKSSPPPSVNNGDSQPPPPIQAEPFHGQVYKSLNGKTVLTIISRDECELAEGRTTLLCKYSKQDGKLRVVTTTLGTSQVIYFRLTNQGLEDNDGNVLLSPERLADIQREIQLKEQREQEEESKVRRETQIISKYVFPSAKPPSLYSGDIAQLTLTDASLKLSHSLGDWTVAFADITGIGNVYVTQMGVYGFAFSYDDITVTRGTDFAKGDFIRGESKQQANDIHDAVLDAYKAWVKKFPTRSKLRSNAK